MIWRVFCWTLHYIIQTPVALAAGWNLLHKGGWFLSAYVYHCNFKSCTHQVLFSPVESCQAWDTPVALGVLCLTAWSLRQGSCKKGTRAGAGHWGTAAAQGGCGWAGGGCPPFGGGAASGALQAVGVPFGCGECWVPTTEMGSGACWGCTKQFWFQNRLFSFLQFAMCLHVSRDDQMLQQPFLSLDQWLYAEEMASGYMKSIPSYTGSWLTLQVPTELLEWIKQEATWKALSYWHKLEKTKCSYCVFRQNNFHAEV